MVLLTINPSPRQLHHSAPRPQYPKALVQNIAGKHLSQLAAEQILQDIVLPWLLHEGRQRRGIASAEGLHMRRKGRSYKGGTKHVCTVYNANYVYRFTI